MSPAILFDENINDSYRSILGLNVVFRYLVFRASFVFFLLSQVGVPMRVAKILTYPDRVTPHNIEQLRQGTRLLYFCVVSVVL